MKSIGSHPRKRKRLTHTTGRASHRHKDKVKAGDSLPREVIWVIAAFIVLAAIIVLVTIN
jgi:hypothetical protein